MASEDDSPPPSRKLAKAAITSTEPRNRKIELTLDDAIKTHIDLVRQQNKHARDSAKDERGWLGRALGNEKHAPTYIALFAIIFGLIIGSACLIQAARDSANADFWSKQAERGFAFAGTALGFVFGRSTK